MPHQVLSLLRTTCIHELSLVTKFILTELLKSIPMLLTPKGILLLTVLMSTGSVLTKESAIDQLEPVPALMVMMVPLVNVPLVLPIVTGSAVDMECV